MSLLALGLNHHTAPVDIRERAAIGDERLSDALLALKEVDAVNEAAIVSTCNRTELYAAGKTLEGIPTSEQMIDFLASERGLKSGDISSNLFAHRNQEAISHLFRVAASLDSMVIGEAQILSQVKQAYQLAVDTGHQIPLTHQVFQTAMKVAKRVATETDIHANRISVPSVAVNVLSGEIFERLDNKRILILGAGEMAEETLTYLTAKDGKDIVVINRTRSKAESLAEKFNGQVADWDDLGGQVAAADLIVSTTSANEPVVTTATFKEVTCSGRQQPLLVLDLAIPRDFDSKIGELPNVFLYTLDDLQKQCEKNRQSRQSQWPKAEKIIQQETANFFQDVHRRNSGQTIAQLKQQANTAKDAELERLLNRLNLSPEEEAVIEQSFHRLVNKILHPPLKSINADKSGDSGGLLEAMKRLFQLGD